VGEKTFGKGVIQNLQELRQGGIAVTIAKYETPLHNNINKVRIICGIVLVPSEMFMLLSFK
jgi:carboxyl-terminal processing protease